MIGLNHRTIGRRSLIFLFYYQPYRQYFKGLKNKKKGVRKTIRVFLLCLFLFGAGWTDLTRGKVRNYWILSGAGIGILLNGSDFFLSALLILIPAYLLFCMGMMGAGDGKLMALIFGYLGAEDGLKAVGTGMLIGAAWSISRLYRDQSIYERYTYLTAYIRRVIHVREWKEVKYIDLSGERGRHTIPLAVCLTVGTYVYLLISCGLKTGKGIM